MCIYIYIYIYIRHRAPSTAWRDSFFERSEYNDFNTQWSMIPTMDDHSSFTNLGPPDPWVTRPPPPPTPPLVTLKPLFRVSTSNQNFDPFWKPWNLSNKTQNPPKTLPKTLPKRLQNSILSSNARNAQKMQPSHTKTSFLMFPGLQKSSQNRCQNAFKIGFILDALLEPQKIWFLMLKRCQDGSPNFPFFFFSKIV